MTLYVGITDLAVLTSRVGSPTRRGVSAGDLGRPQGVGAGAGQPLAVQRRRGRGRPGLLPWGLEQVRREAGPGPETSSWGSILSTY